MRKVLNYLLVVALMLITDVALVNAEDGSITLGDSASGDVTVTVGEVEVPVYSVDIEWYNFVFDWKYDRESSSYGWQVHSNTTCGEVTFADIRDYNNFLGTYYSNDTCTETVELDYESNYEDSDIFYEFIGLGSPEPIIDIYDKSTGGYVTPSLTWNPESKYSFTTASFNYFRDVDTCVEVNFDGVGVPEAGFYTDSACTSELVSYGSGPEGTKYYDWEHVEEAVPFDGVLEKSMSINRAEPGVIDDYIVSVELGIDTTKTIVTPTAGDTIGTLTISIETH